MGSNEIMGLVWLALFGWDCYLGDKRGWRGVDIFFAGFALSFLISHVVHIVGE